MKIFKSSIIITALMLSVAGMAQAESSSGHEDSATKLNQKFKSKRPFHAPVDLKKSNEATESHDGAAAVSQDEESAESKNANHQKRLKANKASRRHQ